MQFQVLLNIYFVQSPVFIEERYNGRVGTFASRGFVDQGSNPCSFTSSLSVFVIVSGMSELSLCIFRRIYVQLPLASQITYECFPFTAVPPTDLKHFNLESSLGSACVATRATSHANALAAIHAQTPATHALEHSEIMQRRSHCLSLPLGVEHTLTRAADHRQRTWLESRTLACVGTQRCRSRGRARERSHGHACAGALITLPRTLCVGSVRTHASASSLSSFKVRRTVAHATGHQQRTAKQRGLTCAQARMIPHALSLSKSNAL